jgi:ribosomal protein S27AE
MCWICNTPFHRYECRCGVTYFVVGKSPAQTMCPRCGAAAEETAITTLWGMKEV